MSQNIYQLFDKTFIDKDDDQTYIDPFMFVWNDMNYWDIKEYHNALSIDSLSDIIDIYSSYVPLNCNKYAMINEFRQEIDLLMDVFGDSSAMPLNITEDTQNKIATDDETSTLLNLQVLEAKFDGKVKHISSLKNLYDIKVGDKEVDVEDDEIGLHVEI